MREWVSSMERAPMHGPDLRDKRWVMRCDVERPDGSRCPTTTEPTKEQTPLGPLVAAGWFIAEIHGDICPGCRAKGYQPWTKPHSLMARDSKAGAA